MWPRVRGLSGLLRTFKIFQNLWLELRFHVFIRTLGEMRSLQLVRELRSETLRLRNISSASISVASVAKAQTAAVQLKHTKWAPSLFCTVQGVSAACTNV